MTEMLQLVNELQRRIIAWEKENFTPYPWRVNRTPYKVLIAEILLKRTTRRAVARIFPQFMTKFPDIEDIYRSPVEDIERVLMPLGLYRQRALQLKRLAEIIVEKHQGKIPDNWEDLVELPGVGPYVAGAVLSFGYGKRAPVVDSNVLRLLGRLADIRLRNYSEALRILWRIVPEKGHELFNYGMIDLGAIVCHYRYPKCNICPLYDVCITAIKSRDSNRASELWKKYNHLLVV